MHYSLRNKQNCHLTMMNILLQHTVKCADKNSLSLLLWIWTQTGVQQDMSGLDLIRGGLHMTTEWTVLVIQRWWLRNDMSNMWEVSVCTFVSAACRLDIFCVQVLCCIFLSRVTFILLLWTPVSCTFTLVKVYMNVWNCSSASMCGSWGWSSFHEFKMTNKCWRGQGM